MKAKSKEQDGNGFEVRDDPRKPEHKTVILGPEVVNHVKEKGGKKYGQYIDDYVYRDLKNKIIEAEPDASRYFAMLLANRDGLVINAFCVIHEYSKRSETYNPRIEGREMFLDEVIGNVYILRAREKGRAFERDKIPKYLHDLLTIAEDVATAEERLQEFSETPAHRKRYMFMAGPIAMDDGELKDYATYVHKTYGVRILERLSDLVSIAMQGLPLDDHEVNRKVRESLDILHTSGLFNEKNLPGTMPGIYQTCIQYLERELKYKPEAIRLTE